MKDREVPEDYALVDVGPYPLYSTALLMDDPAAQGEEHHRRTRMFFCHSIGGQIPGGRIELPATPLETNMRVAAILVDEVAKVTSVDLAIPRVAQAAYQLDPSAGPYEVTERDVAMIAACARCCFYCGSDKPFVETVLAQHVIVSVDRASDTRPPLPPILSSVGGWIARLADFGEHPLGIRRIEKFWGEVSFPRDFPKLGRHEYNPAVVPVVMILNGERMRSVA